MSEENNLNSVREKIHEAIKSGKLSMLPRWHFVWKAALSFMGILIISLALLYLVSFAIFSMYRSGIWFVPSFGFMGMRAFLLAIPWILILASIPFIILLELLVRKYSFGYRKPVLYTLIGIIITVFLGGFIVAQTPLHGTMMNFAEKHRMPGPARFYEKFGETSAKDIHVGKIEEVLDNGFSMREKDNSEAIVRVGKKTQLPGARQFKKGDMVMVFGKLIDGIIDALGIRPMPEFIGRNEIQAPAFIPVP